MIGNKFVHLLTVKDYEQGEPFTRIWAADSWNAAYMMLYNYVQEFWEDADLGPLPEFPVSQATIIADYGKATGMTWKIQQLYVHSLG